MRRRILVTRPAEQSAEPCDRLRAYGFDPIAVPTVEVDRSSTAADLDAMLDGLDGADWLVITSANGAAALHTRLTIGDRTLPPALRVAAIGPATATALADAGVTVHHVPDRYLTVAIANGLGPVDGCRVVLARAEAATPDLRESLVAAGALVEEVVAYRTVEGPAASRDALRIALHGDLAGVTFTSSSAVRGLLRLASLTDRQRARAAPAFCIGPVTAATAQRSGFDVKVIAAEHTATGLADAIAHHFDEGER